MKPIESSNKRRNPRSLWLCSAFFSFLSLGTMGWLAVELTSFRPGIAADEADVSAEAGDPNTEFEKMKTMIQEKMKALEKREADLRLREQQISEKDTVFNRQVQRYEQAISELKRKLASEESGSQTKADSFRQLYEKMDPKKVSQILEQMDPPMASYILAGMKPQLAAEIMSKMSVAKIREITEKYLSKYYASSNAKTKEFKVNEVDDGGAQ